MRRKLVILASQSPRRRQLLEEAGFEVSSRLPEIDDGGMQLHGEDFSHWVESLAWFKMAQVSPELGEAVAIVAADTVCEVDGRILGKPGDRAEAAGMLDLMADQAHITRTGVYVFDGRHRILFNDASLVRVGKLDPQRLEAYLDSGQWQGKAGGYNLSERQADGWPIECEGDPTTVMGLPMGMLSPILERMCDDEIRKQ